MRCKKEISYGSGQNVFLLILIHRWLMAKKDMGLLLYES